MAYQRFRVLAIFASLLLTFQLFSNSVSAAEPGFYFAPDSQTVSKSGVFTADVILDTVGNEVGGAGAIIIFNPDVLEVSKIENGTIFGDYPAATFDNTQGNIRISGIASSPNHLFKGRDIFATITFTAKEIGISTLLFDFTPGSTTDSNIAVSIGTGDIINAVGTLRVTIVEGGETNGSPISTSAPNTSQQLRPTSITSDPYAPIVSQAPITDPDQKQPTGPFTFISSVIPPQIQKAASPYAFVVGLVVITLGVVVLIIIIKLRKKKKSNQPPQTPQPPMSQFPLT